MSPDYSPSRSLPAKIKRRLTQWRVTAPLCIQPDKPVVSFTFDDFPKSAAEEGADILSGVGGKGTYYACSSLAGKEMTTGKQFEAADIAALQTAGHEIGAHTHSHIDCSRAKLEDIHNDIALNIRQLEEMGAANIRQFAYPYGETQVELKRDLVKDFETARGVLAGPNTAASDRMQLRAFQLTPNPKTIQRAGAALKAAQKSPAWIIIFTHDVSAAPSPFGVHSEDLRQLTKMARDIDAEILSVSGAMNYMKAANDA